MTEVDSEKNGLSISMIHVSGRFQPSTGWSVEEKKKKEQENFDKSRKELVNKKER